MSLVLRFRILTSLGIAAVVTVAGAVIAYLVVQAAALFTWPAILGAGVIAAIAAFVIDTVTEPRPQ